VLSVVVQQPPMLSFDASVAPKMCGAHGTTVCIGTGCALASVASSIQSCSSCRISGVILMQLCVVSPKECCKEQNRLLAPYRDGAKLRKVPSSC
jgi:hypothetical protein